MVLNFKLEAFKSYSVNKVLLNTKEDKKIGTKIDLSSLWNPLEEWLTPLRIWCSTKNLILSRTEKTGYMPTYQTYHNKSKKWIHIVYGCLQIIAVDEARFARCCTARGQTKGHDSLHISISTHVIKPHLDGRGWACKFVVAIMNWLEKRLHAGDRRGRGRRRLPRA